jgi:hypothetical protein
MKNYKETITGLESMLFTKDISLEMLRRSIPFLQIPD